MAYRSLLEEKKKALELFRNGIKTSVISKDINVSVRTVSTWKNEFLEKPKNIDMKVEEKQKAIDLIKKGYPNSVIAEKINASASAIKNWRRELQNSPTVEVINNLKSRLFELSKDKKASIDDIKNLVYSITTLENSIK